jgi:hypothetical protein
MFADSDPGNVSLFDAAQQGSTVVLADGEELGRRDDIAGLGTFDLPAGGGRFQVIADASRTLEQVPALSPRTRAEWTFSAPRGTAERVALPLLDVRFALPLDDHNRAAARSEVRGGLTVVSQPGSRGGKVRSVRVEVSYDEGQTWQRVQVDRTGDGWQVRIPRGGAPGGFASLRASATDNAGNAVTETVTRAYALR